MTFATIQSQVSTPSSEYDPVIPTGTDSAEAAKYAALVHAQGLGEAVDYSDDLADAGLR